MFNLIVLFVSNQVFCGTEYSMLFCLFFARERYTHRKCEWEREERHIQRVHDSQRGGFVALIVYFAASIMGCALV